MKITAYCAATFCGLLAIAAFLSPMIFEAYSITDFFIAFVCGWLAMLATIVFIWAAKD